MTAELTDEQVFGRQPGELSDAEVFGQPSPREPVDAIDPDNWAGFLSRVGEGLVRDVSGVFMEGVESTVKAPGQIMGWTPYALG